MFNTHGQKYLVGKLFPQGRFLIICSDRHVYTPGVYVGSCVLWNLEMCAYRPAVARDCVCVCLDVRVGMHLSLSLSL